MAGSSKCYENEQFLQKQITYILHIIKQNYAMRNSEMGIPASKE